MKKSAKKVTAKKVEVKEVETNHKSSTKGLVFGAFDPNDAVGAIAKALEPGKPVKKSVLEKLAKQHKVDAMGRIYRLSRFVRMQKIGHLEISSDAVRLVKGKGKKVA